MVVAPPTRGMDMPKGVGEDTATARPLFPSNERPSRPACLYDNVVTVVHNIRSISAGRNRMDSSSSRVPSTHMHPRPHTSFGRAGTIIRARSVDCELTKTGCELSTPTLFRLYLMNETSCDLRALSGVQQSGPNPRIKQELDVPGQVFSPTSELESIFAKLGLGNNRASPPVLSIHAGRFGRRLLVCPACHLLCAPLHRRFECGWLRQAFEIRV